VPHLVSSPRRPTSRGLRSARLAAVVLVAAGCGSPGTVPPARLGSLPVEPELRATTSAAPRRHAGAVPEVIARPRPFRLAEFTAASDRATEPVTIAPSLSRDPAAAAIRQATAIEPAAAASGPPAVVAEPDSPRVAEIRDMLAGYLRAFNRHDAAAAAAHWTATAENVNLDTGEVTRGREAVREVFAALFTIDAEAAIDIDLEAIRPLRDDVAVIDGVSRVSYADGDVAGSRFSAVVLREADQWRLASVRETATPVAPQPVRPLDQLAWLAGSWEDVGEGVIASSQAAWSAERGFLVRTHTATPDDHPAARPAAGDTAIPGLLPAAGGRRELTEIIGWDPERECIRSWLFTSQGRFAEGVWRRSGEAWTIHVTGLGADAGRDAECVLERSGPDDITVRRTGDAALADLLPPACGFVRSAR